MVWLSRKQKGSRVGAFSVSLEGLGFQELIKEDLDRLFHFHLAESVTVDGRTMDAERVSECLNASQLECQGAPGIWEG